MITMGNITILYYSAVASSILIGQNLQSIGSLIIFLLQPTLLFIFWFIH